MSAFTSGIRPTSYTPVAPAPSVTEPRMSRASDPSQLALLEEGEKRLQNMETLLDKGSTPLLSACELVVESAEKMCGFSTLSQASQEIETFTLKLECLRAESPILAQIMIDMDAKKHLDFLKAFSQSPSSTMDVPETFKNSFSRHDLSKEEDQLNCLKQCVTIVSRNFTMVSMNSLIDIGKEYQREKAHVLECKQQLGMELREPETSSSTQAAKEMQAQVAIDQAIISLDGFFKASTLSFADACTHYQQIAAQEGTENVSKVYLKYAEILSQHLHWFQDGTSDWGKRMFLATAAGVPGGPDASRMVYLRLVAMKWAMGQPAQL